VLADSSDLIWKERKAEAEVADAFTSQCKVTKVTEVADVETVRLNQQPTPKQQTADEAVDHWNNKQWQQLRPDCDRNNGIQQARRVGAGMRFCIEEMSQRTQKEDQKGTWRKMEIKSEREEGREGAKQ
jgi:hypothetical protein